MNHDQYRRSVLAADAEHEKAMQHEPGREPTEPTDELTALRKWKADAIAFAHANRPENVEEINRVAGRIGYGEAVSFFRDYRGDTGDFHKLFVMGVCRGYVLGVNAGTALQFGPAPSPAERMPDTPAPDEVAQLRQELRDCETVCGRLAFRLDSTATALKGDPGPLKGHSFHDLPEIATALSARVAALEAANKSLKAELASLRIHLTPPWESMFPGKEPTSE